MHNYQVKIWEFINGLGKVILVAQCQLWNSNVSNERNLWVSQPLGDSICVRSGMVVGMEVSLKRRIGPVEFDVYHFLI